MMKPYAVLLFVSTCQGYDLLEQYTPDKSNWTTFYEKAVLDNDLNVDHSPDGVGWIDRDEWQEWDGTVYDPTEYSREEFANLICPGSTVRGMYELFYDNNPFADNVNPTKAEVDNWHTIAVNHVRAMVNYTGDEYTIKPDKCLHLRALWSTERKHTRIWDTDEYPGTCLGDTNPHCGASFIPSVEDQQEYLPDDIDSCSARAGSEGLFSSAKSNIPWSIKWIRPFCYTLSAEGFWGGHTGPWFHRTEFGWDWLDNDPSDFNSNAGLRTKWAGPSGPSLYENPDITDGRFTVIVEDVTPDPRFPGYECEGILWGGGADNATECYYRMMEDENCGKRFMTYNDQNFGCACYPPDMATCETSMVAGRLTWDFEPVASSFDGLFIDLSKPLTGNSLPYTGRVCPQIIWVTGAGDASHCLQKIIEGNFDECGRNFMTWNANGGGCACYPPDQLTCTRDETEPQSGRETYELEEDPSYVPPTTSPPTLTATDAPTLVPTLVPTLAPTPTPTSTPTLTPTLAPTLESTESPTEAPITCEDSGFPIVTPQGSSISCAQAAAYGACPNPQIASHCPHTCDACQQYACTDSLVTWKAGSNEVRCVLLAGLDPDKVAEFCATSGALSTTCRETCEHCNN